MKISGIYKITNPEGKIYIGKSINIEKRFEDYKLLNCKNQSRLFQSLAKYGWINHTFELIEECSLNILIERENYYIEHFNTTNHGLNIKGQGNWSETGKIYPEHAKIQKSKVMKEKWKEGSFMRKWSKQIKNIHTGEVYSTMKECCIANKFSHTKLLKELGTQKNFRMLI
jgi:group I intron endonuclease